MLIQLVDRNQDICDQWNQYFKDYPDVVVHCGDFFSLPTDCVVSPANSFGFMDGGLDLEISKRLGWGIQEKLQKIIKEQFDGELSVGQAILIETENSEIPYFISAPTMRGPMHSLFTMNPYLTSMAIFSVLKNNEKIQTVTIPGLGTGIGKLSPDTFAEFMKEAYIDIFIKNIPYPEESDTELFQEQKRAQREFDESLEDF